MHPARFRPARAIALSAGCLAVARNFTTSALPASSDALVLITRRTREIVVGKRVKSDSINLIHPRFNLVYCNLT